MARLGEDRQWARRRLRCRRRDQALERSHFTDDRSVAGESARRPKAHGSHDRRRPRPRNAARDHLRAGVAALSPLPQNELRVFRALLNSLDRWHANVDVPAP